MKYIIKQVKRFIATCDKCGTVFSYEVMDLDVYPYDRMVKCPACDERIMHCSSEVVYDES